MTQGLDQALIEEAARWRARIEASVMYEDVEAGGPMISRCPPP